MVCRNDFVAGAVLLALSALHSSASGQCQGEWAAAGVSQIPGFNEEVEVVHAWDPDGEGPEPVNIIAGGGFINIGAIQVQLIARWDGASWQPMGALGEGFHRVAALATLPSGELLAGGSFRRDGEPSYLAKWDGAAWSSVGEGPGGAVETIAVLPNGDIVVGGAFFGGAWINHWDGISWSSAPYGGFDGFVRALAVLPNGDLVAAGAFATAGGNAASRIARWDGQAWVEMGGGISGDGTAEVFSLAVLPNGDVVAGGRFRDAGGVLVKNIARWDGSRWWPLGEGLDGDVVTMTVLPDGDIVAVDMIDSDFIGTRVDQPVRWNGHMWSNIGEVAQGNLLALTTMPDGDVVAGGFFSHFGSQWTDRVARWNLVCAAEVQCDGTVDVLDLLAYLNFWFASDSAAERDGNETIDVFDLLVYLDDWFAAC